MRQINACERAANQSRLRETRLMLKLYYTDSTVKHTHELYAAGLLHELGRLEVLGGGAHVDRQVHLAQLGEGLPGHRHEPEDLRRNVR